MRKGLQVQKTHFCRRDGLINNENLRRLYPRVNEARTNRGSSVKRGHRRVPHFCNVTISFFDLKALISPEGTVKKQEPAVRICGSSLLSPFFTQFG
jgi:hypothetical protein